MDLVVIEGDGIGKEVIPAAVQVLQSVMPDLVVHPARAGWDCFQETGTPLPQETIALANHHRAVLYGAASSPSYPVDGYSSPIIRLRRLLNTHASVRPTTYLPVPAARAGVDLLVVRENTEGVYGGGEESASDTDTATARKVITRAASERIAHTAYQLARQTGYRRVTVVHKANVLPRTDGLFRQAAFDVSQHYPDIATDELLIDTAAYWMVKEPTRFDVILTLNQYGDILSDMAAAWGGGIGVAPSVNLGENVAIAEPVHGSGQDIAGRGIANPTAAILSAAMLIRYHWGIDDLADRIERAIHQVIEDGSYTPDIQPDGAITATEFTRHVCEKLAS